MATCVALGSIHKRSSSRLAKVGHMRARSRPSSSMSLRRGSGEKKASGERMGLPISSRRVLPSGFPCLKSSSEAPGRPTTSKVGFGMYSEITLRTAIFVRPLIWTYLMSPSYSGGRNFVNASGVSYMWLSASKTGKSTTVLGMTNLRDLRDQIFNFDVNIMRLRPVEQNPFSVCSDVGNPAVRLRDSSYISTASNLGTAAFPP